MSTGLYIDITVHNLLRNDTNERNWPFHSWWDVLSL